MIKTAQELAQYFDHTNLKAFAVKADFEKLCQESMDYGFKMVAINSFPVATCKEILKDSPVHVGAAISFPLGQTTIAVKAYETEQAIKEGADEIDYVVNVGKVKEGNFDYIKEEMETIVAICRKNNILSKVIFESCYLTKDEIKKLAEIALEVLPDFIKTSTGFGTGGALLEDVKLMKSVVGDKVKVKASGGIKTMEQCLALIEAGAERIGSSSSIAIVEAFKETYEK
ncbi:deoxyribose-phosphate aldolase [Enterococcus malodoratus]|uniref:deoxyribose-phosphate aldolase n=1 Tax=Enterococcus malodoratus TaxID=71451 RepID=UPI003FD1CB86